MEYGPSKDYTRKIFVDMHYQLLYLIHENLEEVEKVNLKIERHTLFHSFSKLFILVTIYQSCQTLVKLYYRAVTFDF